MGLTAEVNDRIQWTGDNVAAIENWLCEAISGPDDEEHRIFVRVNRHEWHSVRVGGWIIRQADGQLSVSPPSPLMSTTAVLELNQQPSALIRPHGHQEAS